MISVTVHMCEHCSKSFLNPKECEEHEARHFGLTYKELQEWRSLIQYVKKIGVSIADDKSKKTELAFYNSLRMLDHFEREHNVKGVKIPYSWVFDKEDFDC